MKTLNIESNLLVKDVNVENQAQMYLIFDVNIFRSTSFSTERQIYGRVFSKAEYYRLLKMHSIVDVNFFS